ncbi:MAG: VIT1/CCC1 transporter family protein [Candidatus Micrarchaeia archaeon]
MSSFIPRKIIRRYISKLEGAAFGIADGIICILGLIFGVAIATQNAWLIIIAAVAGGVADALGNSIGFFISQSAERGVQIQMRRDGRKVHVHTKLETVESAVFSFVATIIVLCVLVLPFVFLDINSALLATSVIGMAVLFILGTCIGGLAGEDRLGQALLFVALGAAGVTVGFLVGYLFKI